MLAIGVSNADIEELNKIAMPTSYKNIFYSPTFDDFPSIEREFISSICSEELLSEYKLDDQARQSKAIVMLIIKKFIIIQHMMRQSFRLPLILACSLT